MQDPCEARPINVNCIMLPVISALSSVETKWKQLKPLKQRWLLLIIKQAANLPLSHCINDDNNSKRNYLSLQPFLSASNSLLTLLIWDVSH